MSCISGRRRGERARAIVLIVVVVVIAVVAVAVVACATVTAAYNRCGVIIATTPPPPTPGRRGGRRSQAEQNLNPSLALKEFRRIRHKNYTTGRRSIEKIIFCSNHFRLVFFYTTNNLVVCRHYTTVISRVSVRFSRRVIRIDRSRPYLFFNGFRMTGRDSNSHFLRPQTPGRTLLRSPTISVT